MSVSLPDHLSWLVDTGRAMKTAEGKSVRVLELRHQDDDRVLSAWAKHFRNQYCSDDQIDALRGGTRLSRSEYLRERKFPDQTQAPGPSIRSGDFGEILIADYLEFVLEYWLPRFRYDHKAVRNESTKGTDIIGFRLVTPGRDDLQDTLAIFEAKAKLTGPNADGQLQTAVDGSAKDELRKAESLNAIKQRLIDCDQAAEVQVVERFQNPEDRPHTEAYGAVALMSTSLLNENDISSTLTTSHPCPNDLALIVIHGSDLMPLVHKLYQRAADEA